MPIEKPNVEEQLKDNIISNKEANDLKDFLQNSSVAFKEKKVLIYEIDKKYPDILNGLERSFSSCLKDSLDPAIDDKKNALDVTAFENILNYFKGKTGKESTFSGSGKVNDIFRTIEGNISEYKLNVLTKAYSKKISSDLSSYTNLEQSVITAIEKTLQPVLMKELKKSMAMDGDYNPLLSTYNKFISNTTLPKLTDYQEKADKVLAAVNRASLLSGFEEVLTGDPKISSDPDFQKILANFEEILSDTPDSLVNRMAKDLSLNGHEDLAFESIFTKIKQSLHSKDIYPARFNSFKVIDNKKGISKTDTVQQIEEPYTIRSLDMNQMQASFKSVVSNPSITEIVVTAPTDQKEVVEYFYKDSPNKDKVVLKLVDGLKKVTIDSVESKEVPQKLSLKLSKLDSNMTATKDDITKLLSQNEDMKTLIEDPNYKIVGGTVTGVASLNTNIGYRLNPEYDYTKDSTVRINNQTLLASDPNVVGNQNLALNRAGSFLKYFSAIQDKVLPGAKFDLNYKVEGPTKEALKSDPNFQKNFELFTSKNPNGTESDYLSELFKQRQNATLDLSLLKTETKKNTLSVNVKEELQTKDYAFNIGFESTFGSGVKETTGKILGGIGSALSSLIPDLSGNGRVHYTGCKVCRGK